MGLTRAVAVLPLIALPVFTGCAKPVELEREVELETEARRSAGCEVEAAFEVARTERLGMRVGELDREYLLRLPPNYDGETPTALVLDFHGYTDTAKSEEKYTGLSEHADRLGFAVVYPEGTAFLTPEGDSISSWNDLAGSASPGPEGPICSGEADKYAHPPECGEPTPCNWATCHDDIGFIEELLDQLEASVCLDLDRVYATGMSNGGMFVHRLGCALPDRFAAIAPVGGTLARGFNCAPEVPLSMLNVWGSNDHYVSQERPQSSDGYYYTSADDVLTKWAGAQGCEASRQLFGTRHAGRLGLECVQHDACTSGAEVVHCTWEGGHDWPQSEVDHVGNDLIWDFFSSHSRANFGSGASSD